MINALRVSADHECDLHLFVHHMILLRNFTKGEIRVFSISIFTSINDGSTKTTYTVQKLHKRASMLQWILGRFHILSNEFEMRLKKRIEEEP